MTTTRTTLLFLTFIASCSPSMAQSGQDADSVTPTLRSSVSVTTDIVRIGDLVDNAGSAAQIAIYRAPDLGMTGNLRTSQVLDVLRANQVIGVDTRDIREISVTRMSRTIAAKDVESQISKALEHRNGLGNAADLAMTFDRDLRDIQLNASNTGELMPLLVRYDSRNGRFDVTFDVANDSSAAPTKLRFTGVAIETTQAAVPVRDIERGEILKTSDIVIERRPKTQVGNETALTTRVVGMETRRTLRAGIPLKASDVSRPDLVTRDQTVMITYETAGLYLTGRGKALEGGVEGDTVNVVNLQSKRTLQGTVIGPGQVSINVAVPRITTAQANISQTADSVPSSEKAE